MAYKCCEKELVLLESTFDIISQLSVLEDFGDVRKYTVLFKSLKTAGKSAQIIRTT